MSKDSFFKEDKSSSMGLLNMLNNEIEMNEYTSSSSDVTKKDPRWWIAIVLAFSGLVFGIAIANTQRQLPLLERNRENLRSTISQGVDNLNLTSAELSEVNNEISKIQSDSTNVDSHGIDLSKETVLQITSGLIAITGRGFEIEVSDSQKTDSLETDDIDLAKIFDSDIQLLVNALWSSGAESVSINNWRLTTTSAIRSAGEAILVNYRPLLPPYTIAVIGEPKVKEQFFQHPDFIDFNFVTKTYGLGFKVSDFKKISMPATGVVLPEIEGITVGERS